MSPPLTAKSFRTVVVPVVAPIVTAVPAPNALTVDALVFNKLNVVFTVDKVPPVISKL